MIAYLLDNKEWIFSGIGIAIITALIALTKAAKHILLQIRLKKTPLKRFTFPYEEDEYWPLKDISIENEPTPEFLLNCSIKTHDLLLKKLKKNVRIGESLVWLDIDKFTQVNKLFGNDCGDIIIHRMLMIIAATIQYLDIKAKVFHAENRDEFYIVYLGYEMGEMDPFVPRVLVSAVQRYDWSQIVPNLFVTCSAGIALDRGNTMDTIKRAKVSLDLIKGKGGNGVGPEILKLHPYKFVDLESS